VCSSTNVGLPPLAFAPLAGISNTAPSAGALADTSVASEASCVSTDPT
jgi:hypothetical protein